MLHAGGALAVAMLAFWVYCLLDVIATDESLMRNLPKMPWVFIVALLSPIGGIAWLLLGRPERTTMAPGSTTYRAVPYTQGPALAAGPRGPDDADDFLSDLDRRREEERRLRAWEDDLRRREGNLLGDGSAGDGKSQDDRDDGRGQDDRDDGRRQDDRDDGRRQDDPDDPDGRDEGELSGP